MKIRIQTIAAVLLVFMLSRMNAAVAAPAGDPMFILPAQLQYISEEAFYGNTSIKNLSLREGVTEIGSKAFADCTNIENVVLPDSLIRIEDAAFAGCAMLKKINLPESINFIAEDAFDACTNLVATVDSGSYAEKWCRDAGIDVVCVENDWSTGEY